MNDRGNIIELPLAFFVPALIGLHVVLARGARGHWAPWPVVAFLGLMALPMALWSFFAWREAPLGQRALLLGIVAAAGALAWRGLESWVPWHILVCVELVDLTILGGVGTGVLEFLQSKPALGGPPERSQRRADADYDPEGSYGTWEAILFHPRANLRRRLEAYEALVRWAQTSQDGIEKACYVAERDSDAGPINPRAAFERLEAGGAWQARVEFLHPLSRRPHQADGGKAWFEDEKTELILDESCAASGDFRADIANFFSYRKVIAELAGALGATRFVWGESVDAQSYEGARDIRSLNDEDTLWECFETILHEYTRGKLPGWVRSEFSRALRAWHGGA